MTRAQHRVWIAHQRLVKAGLVGSGFGRTPAHHLSWWIGKRWPGARLRTLTKPQAAQAARELNAWRFGAAGFKRIP
jgi:hypothetical protein